MQHILSSETQHNLSFMNPQLRVESIVKRINGTETITIRTAIKNGFFFITRATLGAAGIRKLVKQEKIKETLPPGRYIEHRYVLRTKRVWPPKILEVRLIFGWKGSELVALVTNLPENFCPATVFEIYARRFWIENTYRDGRLFRVRTRSRRFSVRLAFFLIGLILLNFFCFVRFVLGVYFPFRVISLLVFLAFAFVGSVGLVWV